MTDAEDATPTAADATTAGPTRLVVVKLGGSVVTRKDEPETVADDRLAGLADALADARAGGDVDGLVVVHGGGSFGHHHADRAGVTRTTGTRDAAAVRAIHGAMRRLNDAVVDALADRGVPAVPVHPLSVARRGRTGDLQCPVGSVATLLGEGFVPVLHGDALADAGRGVTILSGDELVVSLARDLDADRVGLCSGVPGVLDADGDVIGTVRSMADVDGVLGGADETDVTGGMAGKVATLLDLGAPAFVFAPAALPAFLAGGDVGTRIDGSGR